MIIKIKFIDYKINKWKQMNNLKKIVSIEIIKKYNSYKLLLINYNKKMICKNSKFINWKWNYKKFRNIFHKKKIFITIKEHIQLIKTFKIKMILVFNKKIMIIKINKNNKIIDHNNKMKV